MTIKYKTIALPMILICMIVFGQHATAQTMTTNNLSAKEISIIKISALAAEGELAKLKPELNNGLEAGLSVNEIKEMLVQLYAYCGFPRSIRGLQTFMEVLEVRKANGIIETVGREASPINNSKSKYDRGKAILAELTKTSQDGALKGYSEFAPTIDQFLKEHLFADIFERDVLSYAQRELVTISVIAAIGNAESMLEGHLLIAMNTGWNSKQLQEFISVIKTTVGAQKAEAARSSLDKVLKNRKQY